MKYFVFALLINFTVNAFSATYTAQILTDSIANIDIMNKHIQLHGGYFVRIFNRNDERVFKKVYTGLFFPNYDSCFEIILDNYSHHAKNEYHIITIQFEYDFGDDYSDLYREENYITITEVSACKVTQEHRN